MSDEPSVAAGAVTNDSFAELTNDRSGCSRALGVGMGGGGGGGTGCKLAGIARARGVVDCD